MNLELLIASLGCAVLGAGHTAVGVRWVFPQIARVRLEGTPFGPASMTVSMLRFTWHIVTLMCLGFAGLLMSLAVAAPANPRTLLLRWLAAVWLAATMMALWVARRGFRSLPRLPVPVVFMLVAVMCWEAST